MGLFNILIMYSGQDIRKPDHGEVRLQGIAVFEASNEYELMSSWLIPHFSKELVDVVQTNDVLRPMPDSQEGAMLHHNTCPLLQWSPVKLI